MKGIGFDDSPPGSELTDEHADPITPLLLMDRPPLPTPRLSLDIDYGEVPIEPGDFVVLTLSMTLCDGREAAGFQAFLRFDEAEFRFVHGTYTSEPFGKPIIVPIVAEGEEINLSAGIDVEHGQPPGSEPANLAYLTFMSVSEGCRNSVWFPKADFDGDMRLKHSISSFDFQGEGSFYNTQGRKYDMNLATGATIAIDLYIPADWGTTVRRADLWATAFDADETISGYPIVGYASYDPADPENPDATPDPRFQFWTNDLNQDGVPDDAGWVDLGLPSDFAYDTWYTLEIELTQTSYVARVISSGDELTVTDIGIGGSVKFGNIIVQAKNYGESYDVYWDNCALPLVATDDCGGPVVVTYERGDNPALTLADPFPGGDTLVTWTAADGCGNEDTWVQTVTVSAFNELVVDVELSPTVVYGPFTRCITFELWDCGTNDSIMVQKTISFENGLGSATLDDVPCGVYDCITARDTLHTLRRTDSDDFGIVGTQYVADFTDEEGDDDRLVGGNLNDDEWIDILDYAILAWQYGENYGSGDTDCDTPYPHADINGDGVVDTADFTFIQTQYLEENEDNCCGMPRYPFIEGPVPDAQSAGPVTRISVHELKRRGLGHLAVGDLNGDGWLDEVDIVLFMNGVRP